MKEMWPLTRLRNRDSIGEFESVVAGGSVVSPFIPAETEHVGGGVRHRWKVHRV